MNYFRGRMLKFLYRLFGVAWECDPFLRLMILSALLVAGMGFICAFADDGGYEGSHSSNYGGIEEQMQDARDYDNQTGIYADDEDDD